MECTQRVADVNEGPAAPELWHPGEVVFDERDTCAGIERGRDEVVAVAGAVQRDETGAVAEYARVECPDVDGRIPVADDATPGASWQRSALT